jgi:hypothetical protein
MIFFSISSSNAVFCFLRVQGGILWDKGQSGPLANYAKNVLQNHKSTVDSNIV